MCGTTTGEIPSSNLGGTADRCRVRFTGFDNTYTESGTVEELMEKYGLSYSAF